MQHPLRSVLLGTVVALATGIIPAPAAAQGPWIQSGGSGGFRWYGQNTIVGALSTGTLASGGSPLYLASMPEYSGVVTLDIVDVSGSVYSRTGSLLPDRRSILTAARCLTGNRISARPPCRYASTAAATPI